MMGNKNLRLLKIFLPVASVCLLLYAFYEYKQAFNEVGVQKRFLRESQEEYKTLTKRFDMLSNELKSAVQATADLDKQLKLEKKDRVKIQKEKEELERQYQTEGVRRTNENAQLSKDKQQLVEEKDEVKRERDRLSARVTSLTAEVAEQAEGHTSKEQQLRDECDKKLNQKAGRVSSLADDLDTCNGDLKESRDMLAQCKQEVAERASRFHHQENSVNKDFQKPDHYGNYRVADDEYHGQRGYQSDRYHRQGYDRFHEGGQRYNDKRNQRHFINDFDDAGHVRNDPPRHEEEQVEDRKDGHRHMDENKKKEIYRSLRRMMANGEDLSPKQKRAYKLLHAAYGNLEDDNPPGGAAAGPVDEGAERNGPGEKIRGRRDGNEAAAPAHGRVDHEVPMDANEHGQQQRMEHIKDDGNDPSHHEVRKGENDQKEPHENPVAQLPQAPVNHENNNNEEEVMDLLEGERQNKDPKEAGAGEDKAGERAVEDNDMKDGQEDVADHVEDREPGNVKNQEEGGQDQPLQNPVLARDDKKVSHPSEEREGQQQAVLDAPGPVGGNEDDEDAVQENEKEREVGEDEQNRVKQPERHEVEMDEGKRMFLHDREMFEKERVKHLQNEPRQGLLENKREQIKAMEEEVQGQEQPIMRRREMR